MKNVFRLNRNLLKITLLAFSLTVLFEGCQEEEIFDPPSNDQVIRYNSELADLVKRISMKDGSSDNILDRASCLTINLPAKVNDNGHIVEIKSIDSIDDLLILKNILDRLDDEEKKLNLVFPVTVTMPDYTETTIRNENDFQNLVNQCTEGGDDEDIECIDFIYGYGLRISHYDIQKQSSNIITLRDDKSLFTFFNDLNENDLVSFNFPVMMVLNGDQNMKINNNQDMLNIIEDAAGNCEEHDDTIFYVEDSGLRDFLIQTGPWSISFIDENDYKIFFADYTFLFDKDGTITAVSEDTSQVMGSWMIQGKYIMLELALLFADGSPFKRLEGHWNIINWGFLEDVTGMGWMGEWAAIDLITIGDGNGKKKKIELFHNIE